MPCMILQIRTLNGYPCSNISIPAAMSFHASASSFDQESTLASTGQKSITRRIAIDTLTALTAAVTVSPIVAAVDKCVT